MLTIANDNVNSMVVLRTTVMYFTCGKTDIACLFSTKQSKSPIWASLLLVQTVGYIDGRCRPAETETNFVGLFL